MKKLICHPGYLRFSVSVQKLFCGSCFTGRWSFLLIYLWGKMWYPHLIPLQSQECPGPSVKMSSHLYLKSRYHSKDSLPLGNEIFPFPWFFSSHWSKHTATIFSKFLFMLFHFYSIIDYFTFTMFILLFYLKSKLNSILSNKVKNFIFF